MICRKEKVRICKIMSIILLLQTILVISFSNTNVMAQETNPDTEAKLSEVRKVAESFVIANYDDKSKRGWDNDTIISSIKAIFDTENNVSSYLVNLGNDGKESGYVIIAADKEEMPIIEYSTSGTAFLMKQLMKVRIWQKKSINQRLKKILLEL